MQVSLIRAGRVTADNLQKNAWAKDFDTFKNRIEESHNVSIDKSTYSSSLHVLIILSY